MQHHYDTITSFAKQAFALMQERNIAPTPENFAVWYHYAWQDESPIKALLTQHIANKTAFTDKLNQVLYEEYCKYTISANPHDSMSDTRDVLNDALDMITSLLSEADTQNLSIQTKLDTIITNDQPRDVATIVEALTTVAKEMKRNSHDMRKTLEESREE